MLSPRSTRNKKHVFLSVIIPAYNAGPTLPLLLRSLGKSTYKDFEVLVGDDASEEALALTLTATTKACKYPLAFIRLARNRGPAGARNEAAKKAHGKVLVFLDSDVEVYPDTLKRIAEKFLADSDLTALTGVWDKHQQTSHFFPQFKALRDWSYWTNERARDGYYYLFSTRIAAIKHEVFDRLHGFNEAFRQMEDVEITYRIARRYAIIFAPDVRVHHEFEGFFPVAKKYFWRSFYWTRLYGARRKFDPVATTMWESITAVTGVLSLSIFIFGIILFFIFPINNIRIICAVISLFLLFIHVFLLRRFLFFVYKERGMSFALQALCTGLLLYSVIIAGALYYQMKKNI